MYVLPLSLLAARSSRSISLTHSLAVCVHPFALACAFGPALTFTLMHGQPNNFPTLTLAPSLRPYVRRCRRLHTRLCILRSCLPSLIGSCTPVSTFLRSRIRRARRRPELAPAFSQSQFYPLPSGLARVV
jgi:hypothetical protein